VFALRFHARLRGAHLEQQVGLAQVVAQSFHRFDGRIGRVTSKDSFVPLGDAARLVLVSEEEIEAAALALLAE